MSGQKQERAGETTYHRFYEHWDLNPTLPRYSRGGANYVSDTYRIPIRGGYTTDTYRRSIRKKK